MFFCFCFYWNFTGAYFPGSNLCQFYFSGSLYGMKTIRNVYIVLQGMVDGSASKPALRQDTYGYMVEKTYYDIAQYLGAFGTYLTPQ